MMGEDYVELDPRSVNRGRYWLLLPLAAALAGALVVRAVWGDDRAPSPSPSPSAAAPSSGPPVRLTLGSGHTSAISGGIWAYGATLVSLWDAPITVVEVVALDAAGVPVEAAVQLTEEETSFDPETVLETPRSTHDLPARGRIEVRLAARPDCPATESAVALRVSYVIGRDSYDEVLRPGDDVLPGLPARACAG